MFDYSKTALAFAFLFLGASAQASEASAVSATKKAKMSVGVKDIGDTPSEGPLLDIPENELEAEAKDEEGLLRKGNFGRLHIFGYGEMHFNTKIGGETNEIDFHRMVLGVGYDFTDRIKFRTEVDFEHAFKEPELEYAYVDVLARPIFNVRVGSILVPMGTINQNHEPPLFYSVERPQLYREIIPSSWQEGGVGFFGNLGKGLDYQLYAMSSLEAATIEDGAVSRSFTGSDGFHDSFGHVGEQPARDFAAAGRLQYKGLPGLRVGSSFFLGNTGQGNPAIGGGFIAMLEGDAKYSFEGIDLESQIAFTHLSDADNINNVILAVDPTFTDFVAKQMLGWSVEGAYHLFHHLMPETKHDLVTFLRYESINTQHAMPAGFAADPANDRQTITVGASYMPIPQVAFKADYLWNWNQANSDTDRFNLGVGFYY